MTVAVSVVVCNYNGAAYLRRCLGSLVALRGPVDEFLLVDNHSSDASLEIVREEFPRFRILENERNAGPAQARNLGMRSARNRWCLCVDNDAVLPPDALEKMLPAALEEGFAMVQARAVLDDEPDRVHYDGGCFHYAGLLALRNYYRPLAEAEGSGVLAVDGAIAICLLLDRELVLELGGYDEGYFILFEDYDLSYRLRSAGHRIASCENVLVRHLGGTAGISFRRGAYPARRFFLHSRNRPRFLLKNHRWRTLLLSLPGLILYELFLLAFALRAGGLGAYLRGKWRFLMDVPQILRLRREVQRRRLLRDRVLLCGGPLTVSPLLHRKRRLELLVVALDGLLSLWWRLVGRIT